MKTLIFLAVLFGLWAALGALRVLVLQPAEVSGQFMGLVMGAGGLAAIILAYLVSDGYRPRRTSITTGEPPGERTGASPSNTP